MELSCVYAELKEWQTGIGALLGFLALMFAAWRNFALNRRRDSDLRREEMLSIATAIYGEILLLRKELADLARIVAKIEMGSKEYRPDFIEIRMLREPAIYPSLTHKVGMLPQDIVLPIVRFYADFMETKHNLPFLIKEEGRPSYSQLVVLDSAVLGVREVGPALRRIENLARIPKCEEPDTGEAETIIEFEEEKFADT